MDRTALRNQALNLATMMKASDAKADDILRDAQKFFDWLSKDLPAADGEKAPVSNEHAD